MKVLFKEEQLCFKWETVKEVQDGQPKMGKVKGLGKGTAGSGYQNECLASIAGGMTGKKLP